MAIELEVKLKDGVSVPAGSAAHQVDVLTRSLKSMQTAMIKAQALGDDKRFNRLGAQYQKMAEQVQSLGGKIPSAADATKKMGAASKFASSEVGQLVQGLTGVNLAAMGTAAVAAAAVAALAAIGAAFAALSKKAYETAANQNLFVAQLNAMGGASVKGDQVVAMLRRMAQVLPFTTKEMGAWAQEMMQAGVRDIPRLQQATKAIAASTAMVGEQGGAAMRSFVIDLNSAARNIAGMSDLGGRLEKMGLTVQEVAKAAGINARSFRDAKSALDFYASHPRKLQELGAVIQDLAIKKGIPSMKALGATVGKIMEKMGDSIAQLFMRIGATKGFQEFSVELQRIALMFGLMTASGKTAENGLVNFFDVVFKMGAKALTLLQVGLLDLQITWLRFRIAIAPTVKDLQKIQQRIEEMSPPVDVFVMALRGLAAVLALVGAGLVVMFAPLALGSALVAGLVGLIAVAIGAIATGLADLGGFIKWIAKLGEELWEGTKRLGGLVIDGIIIGLKGGVALLKKAINEVTSLLPKSIADTLEIKSPSRVMMRLGLALPQGLEQGIEKGAPDAAGAAARMAMGAAGGGAVGVAAVAREGRGGGVVVNLAPGAIQVAGGNGESQTTLVEEAIVAMFERIALTQGVA